MFPAPDLPTIGGTDRVLPGISPPLVLHSRSDRKNGGCPAGPRPTSCSYLIIMSAAADVTDANWASEVLQSTIPVFVDFWAPWCGPCRSMTPYVDKLAEEYRGKLKVVKLNTQDNMEIPSKYGITSIPTFMVIKGGEVKKQIIGAQRYDALKQAVDPHLA